MFRRLRAPLAARTTAPDIAEVAPVFDAVARRDADRLHLLFPVPRLLGMGLGLLRVRRWRARALRRVELVGFVKIRLVVYLQTGPWRAARGGRRSRLGRDALLLLAFLLRLRLDDGRDCSPAVSGREVRGGPGRRWDLVWACMGRPSVLPRWPVGGDDRILRWVSRCAGMDRGGRLAFQSPYSSFLAWS